MTKKLGDIHVDVGNNNTIGHIGHVIHLNSKARWVLGDELRNYIRAQVPRNKLAVVWFTTGNEDSLQVAQQVYRFMNGDGFQLYSDGPVAQVYLTPTFDVTVSPGNTATNVNVGIPTKS